MSAESDDKVVECLDMAMHAARKADAAESPGEAQFWQKMEQRWVRLAQTYRATDQLVAAWRRPRVGQPRVSSPPSASSGAPIRRETMSTTASSR
jgi:hypothetical protein